jgi:molybdopterin molybdotransferase
MRDDLVPAAQALQIVLDGAAPSLGEQVPLSLAHGRVLAKDLAALRTQPPFRASAMDGYALRGADVQTAPVTLRIIGEAAAGHPFQGTLVQGEAVRIFTGAPVPDGADTVQMQENTTRQGDAVTILKPITVGHSVRAAGLDFREGDTLLRAGDVLDPQRLSLAASMNYPAVPVWRRPRIALAATGDELRLPGEATGPGEIIASNTFGLAAIIASSGGELRDLGILADDPAVLDAAFAGALDAGADVIVTTGGASVGDHDLVKPAFERLGAQFAFSKIAMRPGKPLIFGTLTYAGRTVRCLGIAGNPVSSLIAGHVFLRPLIAALGGYPPAFAAPLDAVTGCDLPANGDREDHMRASARRLCDGTLEVTPFGVQDSSMQATLARADAILVRPPFAPAAQKGEACRAVLMRNV